jgi:hypothetical protein
MTRTTQCSDERQEPAIPKEVNEVTSQPDSDHLPTGKADVIDDDVDGQRDHNGMSPEAIVGHEARPDPDADGADSPSYEADKSYAAIADGSEGDADVNANYADVVVMDDDVVVMDADGDADAPGAPARAAEADDYPDMATVDDPSELDTPSRSTNSAGADVEADTDSGAHSMSHVDTGSAGSQWHDIQAMFVDDPRGSVRRAAEAADDAVAALADLVQQRRGALTAAGSRGLGAHGETEELREQLRSYRIFCQSLADLGQQLPEVDAAAR